MSSNANNTTSGDNSSDSASNKNNNTKSQLEIVEQKLKKCSNEIESLKKRYESMHNNIIVFEN
jgi:molecular chaperone GrpE (heat shock protein)